MKRDEGRDDSARTAVCGCVSSRDASGRTVAQETSAITRAAKLTTYTYTPSSRSRTFEWCRAHAFSCVSSHRLGPHASSVAVGPIGLVTGAIIHRQRRALACQVRDLCSIGRSRPSRSSWGTMCYGVLGAKSRARMNVGPLWRRLPTFKGHRRVLMQNRDRTSAMCRKGASAP
jgi:hypothetical protein